jgi:hypothetical protein
MFLAAFSCAPPVGAIPIRAPDTQRPELSFELRDGDPTAHMLLQQFVIALFQSSACYLRALLVLRSLCLQLSFGFVTFSAGLAQEFNQCVRL